jgi:hypothetical protein
VVAIRLVALELVGPLLDDLDCHGGTANKSQRLRYPTFSLPIQRYSTQSNRSFCPGRGEGRFTIEQQHILTAKDEIWRIREG